MSLLYVLAGLLLLKFVLNLSRYAQTKWHLSRYMKWLSESDSTLDSKLLESKAQVVRLLKEAEVADSRLSVTQPIGYGHISAHQASVLNSFPSDRADFANVMHRNFRQAIGTYRSRMIEAFNPLYWIETIIYLPREALRYLGVSSESGIVKVLQLIWWIIGSVVAILWVVFRPEIGAMIRDWLSTLLS